MCFMRFLSRFCPAHSRPDCCKLFPSIKCSGMNYFFDSNIARPGRFFKLFSNRVSRLHDMVNSLLEYTVQIRDTYQSRLDVKQNRIMTVLTIVTTIFMPLTLIVGWYGMNFKYMPELDSVWGYPVVIIVSLLIVISSLLFFKRKKWL